MARAHDGLRPFSAHELRAGPPCGAVRPPCEAVRSVERSDEEQGRASASPATQTPRGIGWLLFVLALVALVAVGALIVVIRSARGSGAEHAARHRPVHRRRALAAAGQRRGAVPGPLPGAGGLRAGRPDPRAALGGGRPHRRRRRRVLGDRPAGSKLDRTASQMRIEVTKSQLAGLPETDDGAEPRRRRAPGGAAGTGRRPCPPGGHGPRCREPAPPPRGPVAGEARLAAPNCRRPAAPRPWPHSRSEVGSVALELEALRSRWRRPAASAGSDRGAAPASGRHGALFAPARLDLPP